MKIRLWFLSWICMTLTLFTPYGLAQSLWFGSLAGLTFVLVETKFDYRVEKENGNGK